MPRPSSRASSSVIPGETRTASSPRVFCGENLSYSFSGGFSVGGVDFADGVAGFPAASFPTVKYLRIFLRRFAPSPRIASKSSTLLKAPHDLRICKILSAVAGPLPRHQLQFFRGRRIEIYRLGGLLFPSRVHGRGKDQADKKKGGKEPDWKSPRHDGNIMPWLPMHINNKKGA